MRASIAGLLWRAQPGDDRSMVMTREALANGTLRELLAKADPTLRLLSDEERWASLRATFGDRLGAEDVWVFAYGSLIWNPICRFAERRLAVLHGWHRRFCLWTSLGRGSPDRPGLMLALDRGGSCRGIAYRILAAEAELELDLLWRREMVSGSYCPRLVPIATPEGRIEALAFTINRCHPRYAGRLPEENVADIIAAAKGVLGPCAEYLVNTVDHLEALGLRDRGLQRLRDRLVASGNGPVAPG
jgi:cation transport protein ChaC